MSMFLIPLFFFIFGLSACLYVCMCVCVWINSVLFSFSFWALFTLKNLSSLYFFQSIILTLPLFFSSHFFPYLIWKRKKYIFTYSFIKWNKSSINKLKKRRGNIFIKRLKGLPYIIILYLTKLSLYTFHPSN